MDILKKLWPLSFRIKSKGAVKPFVITLVLYVVVEFVAGVIFGLLALIPYVGFIFSIISYLCGLYCTAGIVFTILRFIGVGPFRSETEKKPEETTDDNKAE